MATKTKPSEREQQIAGLLRGFLHCWQGQPGRARQLAEELTALLPEEQS
jgi:hypothetical protein